MRRSIGALLAALVTAAGLLSAQQATQERPGLSRSRTLQLADNVVQIDVSGSLSLGLVVQPGSFIGVLVAECSMDGGAAWIPTYFNQRDNGQPASNWITLNAPAAAFQGSIALVGGCALYRVRVQQVVSGSVTAQLRTAGFEPTAAYMGTPGSTAVPPVRALVGGVDYGGVMRSANVSNQGGLAVQSAPAPALPLPPCNPVRTTQCSPKGY